MGPETELISVAGDEVMIGSKDDKIGLRVGAVQDGCDGGRVVDLVAVADLVVMVVEDKCVGGRLVDSAAVADLVVMVVEDTCDGVRLVDSTTVAELVIMAVKDTCDSGRLVDSVTQVELVVMECVTVEIEERVLAVEHTEVEADEVTVAEFLC